MSFVVAKYIEMWKYTVVNILLDTIANQKNLLIAPVGGLPDSNIVFTSPIAHGRALKVGGAGNAAASSGASLRLLNLIPGRNLLVYASLLGAGRDEPRATFKKYKGRCGSTEGHTGKVDVMKRADNLAGAKGCRDESRKAPEQVSNPVHSGYKIAGRTLNV